MTIPSKYTDNEKMLGLSMVTGIGEETIRSIWNGEGLLLSKLSRRQLSELKKFDWSRVDDELQLMSKKKCWFITFLDDEYPEALRNITDFPPIIFFKGNLEALKRPIISIVGTRKISDYGKQCIRKITEVFVQKRITVASGMAFGIDAAVHNYVLANNGSTIAVLASGVDVPSPATNAGIYNRIIQNDGLIISEQTLGTVPIPGFFPLRNRIISGLAKATIVIEAGQRSGALITAYQAFEQNREVYAVPGDITAKRSLGTNKIIRNGIAKLLTSAEEVLEDLGYVINQKEERKIKFDSDVERDVFHLLSDSKKTIDEIGIALGLDISEVLRTLTSMELKGMVASVNSKYCLCL